MSRSSIRPMWFVPVLLFGSLGVLYGWTAAPQPADVEEPATAAIQEEDEYVGSDLCQECHAEQWDSFVDSFHYARVVDGHDEMTGEAGCESCHGPGLRHVEMAGAEEPGFRDAIVSFTKEAPSVMSEQCMSCHAEQAAQSHFNTSVHSRAGLTCADCHNPHLPLTVEFDLRQEQPNLCFDCHGDQRGRFALTEHHPVEKGVMDCTDCHNPHGSTNSFQLARAENSTCTKCHMDKEGPWVFPHPPVEAENCTICHQPHGSVNRHMLGFREIRFVCLQCHPSQPGFHVQPGFALCNECHTQMHGSNLDPFFLR